ARAVLRAAALTRDASRPLDGLRTWATEVQRRTNHNKAACALANKLARICYAVLRDHAAYGNPQPRPDKKLQRTAFAIAA
ncbi:IS110 family transposase, partial [Azoarcus indigens]|nr:IS110 family transposase [Azoarcus indigens]